MGARALPDGKDFAGGIVAVEVEKVGEQTYRGNCCGIFASRASADEAAEAAARRYAKCHDLRQVSFLQAGSVWFLHWQEAGEAGREGGRLKAKG